MVSAIDHFAKVIPDLLAVQTRLHHFLRFARCSVSHLTKDSFHLPAKLAAAALTHGMLLRHSRHA